MESLEPLLLKHLIEHFSDILTTNVDFSGSSKRILRYVGERITTNMIESIKGDHNASFKNKLYMYQLEKLILSMTPELTVCSRCFTIFTTSHTHLLQCHNSQAYIDYHGEIACKHIIVQNVNFADFANSIHSKHKYPWRSIYWKLWSCTVSFYCSKCEQYFRGLEAYQCRAHCEKPIMVPGENECRYPCCNVFCKRFQTDNFNHLNGCNARLHIPLLSSSFDTQVLLLSELETHNTNA